MGEEADQLMEQAFFGCDEWCDGCTGCAEDDQWVTNEGQVIPIKKLEDSHLFKVIRYIRCKRIAAHFGFDRYRNLVSKAERRGLKP